MSMKTIASEAVAAASGLTVSPRTLHVLTLTPFFPFAGDPVKGCFVAEPLSFLQSHAIASDVIAVSPIYRPERSPSPGSPATWVRYPQLPGNFGLATAGTLLYRNLLNAVSRIHQERPIDLIHAHSALPCGHAALLLSRRLNIPFVVTVHGLDVFNACFEDGMAASWRKRVSLNVYRRSRMVICISARVRHVLLSVAGNEVQSRVVYNGTDPVLFSQDPKESCPDPEILMVANLLRGKGHELVLDAMGRLKNLYPNLGCRMIGEGPDQTRFAAKAKQLGIDKQLEFLGQKSRVQIAEAMRRCTVFVLPSRYEALGCVYLEAMACGKPVIACREQGIAEIIRHGENGMLVPVDGVEELVKALDLLLRSAALRAQMGDAARQTILRGLTLSHQAERLAETYREAVQ